MLNDNENKTLDELIAARKGAKSLAAFTRKMSRHSKPNLIYQLGLALARMEVDESEVEDALDSLKDAIHERKMEAAAHDAEKADLQAQINEARNEACRWHRIAVATCISIADESSIVVESGGIFGDFKGRTFQRRVNEEHRAQLAQDGCSDTPKD